ncbi:MAG: hypothetical protein WCS94_10485 [Verrucomicrobiota bacterium]
MKEDERQFLTLLSRPPARLTVEQVAWVLNCQPHDIATLIAARMLKPLGAPSPNSTKYFATVEVLESTSDRAWLNRVTQTIQQFWLGKNRRRMGTGSRFSSVTAQKSANRRLSIA